MRVNRLKQARKCLKFFQIVFNINPPYRIILDGNFIYSALSNKIDIVDRFVRLLQTEAIKWFVCKSVLEELRKVGKKTESVVEFINVKCEIIDDTSYSGETPAEKLLSFLSSLTLHSINEKSNWRNFFVATQDIDLRQSLRRLAGVPLIYLNKVILVIEPPSDSSKEYNQQIEVKKTGMRSTELETIHQIKASKLSIIDEGTSSRGQDTTNEKPKGQPRLKRKANAPNPLSSRQASDDSNKTKKRKVESLIRRK